MKQLLASGAVLTVSLNLVSCGASVEDRMVSYLAETICMADEAYRAIDAAKTNVSQMSVQDLLKKTDEISKKIDALKSTSFGSTQQLEDAKNQLKDKKAVAQRAIEAAKAKCQPGEMSIEQATRDYQ